MVKSGYAQFLTKIYRLGRAEARRYAQGNAAPERRLERQERRSWRNPVEAGLVAQFFEPIERQQRRLERAAKRVEREALRASKRSAPIKEQKSKGVRFPPVILRQVNGVIYEYHRSLCFPAPAVNTARELLGLEPLKPKYSYTRSTYPMTKGGFTFVCNAKRARFSIKKIRRGAPQKPIIFRKGDEVVFRMEDKNVLKSFAISIAKNRFEGPLPTEEEVSGFIPETFKETAEARLARKAKQMQRAKANRDRRQKAVYRRLAFEAWSGLNRKVERSIMLLTKVRSMIREMRLARCATPSLNGDCRKVGLSCRRFQDSPKFQHEMLAAFRRRAFSKVDNFVDQTLNEGHDFIQRKCAEIFEKVRSVLPTEIDEYKLQNILIHVVSAVANLREGCAAENIGLHFVGILSTLKMIRGKTFWLSSAITAYVKFAMQEIRMKQAGNTTLVLNLKHESEIGNIEGPLATLMVTIFSMFNIVLHPEEKVPNFFSLRGIKEFTATSNSATIFVRNHLEQLIKCFEWCHARVNRYLFDRVISEQPDLLRQFLREASAFVNEAGMYEQIVNSPILQHKVFKLMIQANKLSCVTIDSSRRSQLHASVRVIISKLNALQERLINDCIAPNVGYEPFVLQLAGIPGVGKTTIVTHLVPELLKAINYRTVNEMIFVRSIGTDFWNGVCNQPFIVYDDMFIDQHSAPAQLAEWMQLKSSVPFNPNCAHLEDKKRRISPIGLIINSNLESFSNLNFMYDTSAIDRRRDVLYKVTFEGLRESMGNDERASFIKKTLDELGRIRMETGKTDLSRYRFKKAENVRSKPIIYGNEMTYEEFVTDCKDEFVRYRVAELKAYEERFDLLTAVDDSDKLLTSEEVDQLCSDRVDEYIRNIEEADPSSFMNMMRKVVDSGRSAIYGRDCLNPVLSSREKVDMIENVLRETLPKTLEHQMDSDNTIQSSVTKTADATVVSVDQGPISSTTEMVNVNRETSLVTIEGEETFEHMAGHLYLHRTIDWLSTQTQGTSLVDEVYPKAFFNGEFRNSANIAIFRNYRFFRFDLEVEIKLNAAKMELGRLIAGWNYGEKDELDNLFYRRNIHQIVQGPHCFITASNNSVARFEIPYKFIWPMIQMRPDFNLDSFLRFNLCVMNQLKCYDAASTQVAVSIFFRFKNLSKAGLFYNLGIKHEMLEQALLHAGVGLVEKLVRKIFPDGNRDKPTEPRDAPVVVVRPAHSFAHGTNVVDYSQIMRLDPLSTAPHFDVVDQLKVDNLVRIFGFIGTHTWRSNYICGTEIFLFEVNPLRYMISVPNRIVGFDYNNNLLPLYNSTPIGVVSSCFSYWNGDLELRFDLVSSFMMTGRLFVCFIPDSNLDPELYHYYTFEKCKSFYGTYFDLGEETSFSFIIPYVNNMPWLVVDPSYSNSKLGIVKMFVVNPLKSGSVVNEIDVNTFVRAGSRYSLAIPTLPKVSPGIDRHFLKSISLFKLRNPEAFFKSKFPVKPGDQQYEIAFCMDSNGQFNGIVPVSEQLKIYRATEDVQLTFVNQQYPNDTQIRYVSHFMSVSVANIGDSIAPIIGTLDSEDTEMLNIWFDVLDVLNKARSTPFAKMMTTQAVTDILGKNYSGFPFVAPGYSCEQSSGKPFFYQIRRPLTHESDMRTETTNTTSVANTSVKGDMPFFGEGFSDLKDLMRRFQFYGDFKLKVSKDDKVGNVQMRIPIIISGLSNHETPNSDPENEIFNQQRTGLIPLIGSGFRFYRGGLRFKLCYDPVFVTNITVTFVHDRFVAHTRPYRPSGKDSYAYAYSGYPMVFYSGTTSGCMEFEIPYYKRSLYVWANRLGLDNALRHTLGYLDIVAIKASGVDSSDTNIRIFYSLADDSRFTTFQGFPAIISLRDIPVASSVSLKQERKERRESFEVVHEMEQSASKAEEDGDEIYRSDVFVEAMKESSLGDRVVSDITDPNYGVEFEKCSCPHRMYCEYKPEDCAFFQYLENGKEKEVFAPSNLKMKDYSNFPLPHQCLDEICWFQSVKGQHWIKAWVFLNFKRDSVVRQSNVPPMFRKFVRTHCEKKIVEDAQELDGNDLVPEEEVQTAKSLVQRIREKCKEWINFKALKSLCKWLGIIGALIAGAFVGWKFFGSRTNDNNEVDPDHEYHYDPDLSSRVRTKNNALMRRSGFGTSKSLKSSKFVEHQSSSSLEDVIGAIKKNLYVCMLKCNDKQQGMCKVLALGGHLFIGIKHFFDKARACHMRGEKVEVILTRPNISYNLVYASLRIDFFSESSLVLFTVPSSVRKHRDISRHFATEMEHSYASSSCMIYDYRGEESVRKDVVVKIQGGINVPASGDLEEVFIPSSYSYNYGYAGACGALLFNVDNIPKIVGIHIAGNVPSAAETKRGFAEPVFFEAICDQEELRHEMIFEEIEGVDESMEMFLPAVKIPEQVIKIGTVDKSMAIYGAMKSEKVKTKIYNQIYKSNVMPAPLIPNDRGDPLSLALSKYANVPKSFELKYVEKSVCDIKDMFVTFLKPVLATQNQWLTDQQVFSGVPGNDNYKGINLQSSEGYPLCLLRTSKGNEFSRFYERGRDMSGKSWLFKFRLVDNGRILEKIHPLLMDLIETNRTLRENGVVPVTIFISTLKDQCISCEKVLANKNRVFSNAPIQNTWDTKKYFGHWQAAYNRARFDNESAIGINPESTEWNVLAQRLLERGTNLVTGDYSAFGDTLARDLMWKAYECIEYWYNFHYGDCEDYDYCRNQRFMLFAEMCEGLHLARNVLFSKIAGIPSGFALTVEINDLVNKLYIRYCFYRVMGISSNFSRYCYLCCYGDDMIMSVSDVIKDKFDFTVICDILAEKGIKFTPASKDDNLYKFQNIYESTFLKANFVWNGERRIFVNRLPLQSCLEQLNWKNRSISDDVYLFSAFRGALRSMHGHGKKEFDRIRNSILKAISENCEIFSGVDLPHIPSWEGLDEEMYGMRL